MNRVTIDVKDKDGLWHTLDTPDNIQVTLNYTSPMFGSIQDIKTSYSQTVTIPKTEHNDALLSRLAYPQSEGFVEYLTARVTSDGFPIIDNGRMVVTSASASGYAATILFGEILERLRAWIDGKPMLTELTRYSNDYLILADDDGGGATSAYDYTGGQEWDRQIGIWGSEMLSKYDPQHYFSAYFVKAFWQVDKVSGDKVGDKDYAQWGVVNRPFISFIEIMSRIQIDNGLTFRFDQEVETSMRNTGLILGKRVLGSTFSNQYYVVDNLPDISQLDFVLGICNYYGIHPTVTAEDEVTFVSFSNMYEGRAAATDWSEKIISKDDFPKKTEFSFFELKQQNNCRYADDNADIKGVSTNGGWFWTKNESLEKKGTFVELPFSHTNIKQGLAVFPSRIRKTEDDGTFSYEWNDFNARIATIGGLLRNPTKPQGYDATSDYRVPHTVTIPDEYIPMEWATPDYRQGWLGFEFIAYSPKVITEDIRITAYELKNFDWSKPVYIAKYARYYAVSSIRWQTDSDLAEAKLIQMDEHWEIFN